MESEILKQSLLFAEMTDDEIAEALLSLRAVERVFEKNALILRAGEQTKKMGLVLSGSVTVESVDLWGNRAVLSLVSEGEFFAETYAMVPSEVMLVDVRAAEKTRILFLEPGILFDFEKNAVWKEKMLRRFLQISAQKNLALSSRSIHTAPKSARARILSYLSSVSIKKQSPVFDIPFDRQQMADYLNLERTNMSKELSRMQREGILTFRKNHFRLLTDPENSML